MYSLLIREMWYDVIMNKFCVVCIEIIWRSERENKTIEAVQCLAKAMLSWVYVYRVQQILVCA